MLKRRAKENNSLTSIDANGRRCVCRTSEIDFIHNFIQNRVGLGVCYDRFYRTTFFFNGKRVRIRMSSRNRVNWICSTECRQRKIADGQFQSEIDFISHFVLCLYLSFLSAMCKSAWSVLQRGVGFQSSLCLARRALSAWFIWLRQQVFCHATEFHRTPYLLFIFNWFGNFDAAELFKSTDISRCVCTRKSDVEISYNLSYWKILMNFIRPEMEESGSIEMNADELGERCDKSFKHFENRRSSGHTFLCDFCLWLQTKSLVLLHLVDVKIGDTKKTKRHLTCIDRAQLHTNVMNWICFFGFWIWFQTNLLCRNFSWFFFICFPTENSPEKNNQISNAFVRRRLKAYVATTIDDDDATKHFTNNRLTFENKWHSFAFCCFGFDHRSMMISLPISEQRQNKECLVFNDF